MSLGWMLPSHSSLAKAKMWSGPPVTGGARNLAPQVFWLKPMSKGSKSPVIAPIVILKNRNQHFKHQGSPQKMIGLHVWKTSRQLLHKSSWFENAEVALTSGKLNRESGVLWVLKLDPWILWGSHFFWTSRIPIPASEARRLHGFWPRRFCFDFLCHPILCLAQIRRGCSQYTTPGQKPSIPGCCIWLGAASDWKLSTSNPRKYSNTSLGWKIHIPYLNSLTYAYIIQSPTKPWLLRDV